MKTQFKNLIAGTTKTGWEGITKLVSESVSKETSKSNKIFSAVDMWNIQRRRKSFIIR